MVTVKRFFDGMIHPVSDATVLYSTGQKTSCFLERIRFRISLKHATPS